MALTATEIVNTAALVLETLAVVAAKTSSLTTEEETLIRTELASWLEIKDQVHIRIKGGSRALDLEYDRKIEQIRQRVRKILGFSLYSEEIAGGSTTLFNVPVF